MTNHTISNKAELQKALRASLTQWQKQWGENSNRLVSLLVVQSRLKAEAHSTDPLRETDAVRGVIKEAFEEFAKLNQNDASILQSRYFDGITAKEVGINKNLSRDQITRIQQSATKALAQLIWEQETILRQEKILTQEALLPPANYTQLFGLDQTIELLTQQLIGKKPSPIVAIVGIGGIGKTSLADALARLAIASFNFKHIIWLRAGNHNVDGAHLPAQLTFETLLAGIAERLWPNEPGLPQPRQLYMLVRRALKEKRHLIIIDNLETESEMEYMIDRIADLATPTQFLLTSRTRPDIQSSVYTYSLDELPADDALPLIRHHADAVGLPDLANAPTNTLTNIYDITGGNPLALKLVVGLASILSLSQILTDLKTSQIGPIEDLYHYIYWKAWQSLSQEGQALLIAMPLVSGAGAQAEQLAAISGLPDDELWSAIRELVTCSLLEARGTALARRYGVHRLTETFVRTEIVAWAGEVP